MSWAVIHGRRLATIRRDRGLTQRELAFAIGRTGTTICLWESNGSAEIRLHDARKCANALRCWLKDLAAPLDAPLPPAPENWPRVRRRIKLEVAAVTRKPPRGPIGAPPLWALRVAAILKERPAASAR